MHAVCQLHFVQEMISEAVVLFQIEVIKPKACSTKEKLCMCYKLYMKNHKRYLDLDQDDPASTGAQGGREGNGTRMLFQSSDTQDGEEDLADLTVLEADPLKSIELS